MRDIEGDAEWRAEQVRRVTTESDDQYVPEGWHAGPRDVTKYETEEVVDPFGKCRFTVEWYLSADPVPERYRNHGWMVRACYRLPGMNGYEYVSHPVPVDIDARMYDLHAIAEHLRGIGRAAIRAGMRATLEATKNGAAT